MARKKKRAFLTVLRLMGLFIGGMVVAISVALSQVNIETLRGNILSVLQDATGLPVEIDGAVSWKFSLRPQIELNNVRIPNADWAKEKYGFDTKKIDVKLNLISLLRNRPTIQSIKVYDAKIAIEQNEKGEYSIGRNNEENNDNTDDKKETNSFSKYPFT